jgi:hypothetical protein
MIQYCGSTISLSACGHTATIAEPLFLHFQPLRRVACDRTGNAELGAFAFQGRCFVVVQHGQDVQAEIDVGPGAIRFSSAPVNAELVSSPATTTKHRHPQGGH